VFAIYPGVIIWKLQLPLWKKLTTIGFMGLGIAYVYGVTSRQSLTMARAFAFATVKVSANATLLGEPTLNQLLNRALHIGLWNSIENDFVMIAACLPSVRPLLKASWGYASTHLSTSKPTRVTSSSESQRSLNTKTKHGLVDDSSMELASKKDSSDATQNTIQMISDYNVSHQPGKEEQGGHDVPPYRLFR
jgi:hypothetical protein